jgi:hypothetical protein
LELNLQLFDAKDSTIGLAIEEEPPKLDSGLVPDAIQAVVEGFCQFDVITS